MLKCFLVFLVVLEVVEVVPNGCLVTRGEPGVEVGPFSLEGFCWFFLKLFEFSIQSLFKLQELFLFL